MEITCPKCSKATTFNVTEAISCQHCQTSFHSLKLAKKAIVTAWTALAVGGYAGHKIDSLFATHRYPAAIEYAVIERCTTGGRDIAYQRQVARQFGVCTCALEQAQQHIDYRRYQSEPTALSNAMRAAVPQCISP